MDPQGPTTYNDQRTEVLPDLSTTTGNYSSHQSSKIILIWLQTEVLLTYSTQEVEPKFVSNDKKPEGDQINALFSLATVRVSF
jgi:hypothetical protein